MSRAVLLAVVGVVLAGCPDGDDPGDPVTADAGEDLLVEVGEPLRLDGSGSTGPVTAFAWDLGDGRQAQGVSPEVSWSAPGHYSLVLEVSDEAGRSETDAAQVTVVWPLAPGAPGAARTGAADDTLIYVALPDFDLVAVVDPVGPEVVDHLEVCAQPRSVAAAGDRLVVACGRGDAFEIWEGDSRVVHQEMPFRGSPPRAAVLDEDSVYVVHDGLGGLSRWSVDNDVQLEWFSAGLEDSRGLALLGDDVLLSRHRSPADGGVWWLGAGASGEEPEWAEQTLAVDPGPDSDTTTRGVPTYLQRVLVSPDGRTAWFPSLQANVLRGEYRDGLPLTHETTARAVLSQASLVEPVGAEGARKVFDDRDMAVDVAFSPRGDWLYVAMLGMEAVDVLDAYTLEAAGSFQGLGHGVDGVLVRDGVLWVAASLSRELVAIALDGPGSGAEVARLDLRPFGDEALAADVLLGKQLFHRAADPRMSFDGYLSCGSCHLDGDGDGRVWDFTDRGEGLRNTVELHGRGGVLHGPIHWSANFDEVQDFENDIRGPMAGAGFLPDADWEATSDTLGAPKAGRSEELDALAAYVESLVDFPVSPFRDLDGGLTPEAEAGRAIFNSGTAGCAECHPLPDYTDSQWLAPGQPLLHDVGTLTDASGGRLGGELLGIDTPTLRGVWSTPPYLHDGSAETLWDVLVTRNPADEHGGTSHLTVAELESLARYLMEIE